MRMLWGGVVTQGRTWLLIATGVATITIVVAVAWTRPQSEAPSVSALGAAIEGADTVELWWSVFDPDGGFHLSRRESVNVTDTVAVDTLVKALRHDSFTMTPSQCECAPEWGYNLYREGSIVAHLSVHHETYVRWSGWTTQAQYPPEIGQELVEWATEHGLPYY